MSTSPPSTLGKYQIIREIARSNDIVYEAYDPLMNRRVAIKELSMPTGANAGQRDDRIKRFLREARAVGSLTHPNIMTVFEVGQDGDRHFIAMEYLDGHTLRNEIDTKGFLPPDEAVELAKKVLSGLEYAHSKGVIHRDIKPDNIQILSDGRIKVTDFGIARLTFEPNLTMDGQVFGTPSYMSPEQVVGRDIDARSDLFSVGILLYEMIAGQKPFGGDSVVSITYAIMNKEPDRPNQANFALWQVIEKALDKSPQLRYSNAAEMIAALDNAQKAVQPGSMVIDPGRPQIGGSVYQPGPGYFAPPVPGSYQQHQQQQQMNPYAGQPAPPPVVYPYNPYQQPGGVAGQVAPHTPAYSQQPYQQPYQPQPSPPAYTQAPIYYPPPPRQPLLKPETRFFLGRLMLWVVLIGLAFSLIIFAINALSSIGTGRQQAAKTAPAPVQAPAANDPVKQAAENVNTATNPVDKNDKQAELAKAQEAKGIEQLQSGQDQDGVNSLTQALANDPSRTGAAIALAEYFDKHASAAVNPDRKADMLSTAADSWEQASRFDIDPQAAKNEKQKAATDYLALAELYAANDKRPDARDALNKGLKVAKGLPIEADLRNLLNKLS